jgi:hypothetical protein
MRYCSTKSIKFEKVMIKNAENPIFGSKRGRVLGAKSIANSYQDVLPSVFMTLTYVILCHDIK